MIHSNPTRQPLKITHASYYNSDGKYLFTEIYRFSRLSGINETWVNNYIIWQVLDRHIIDTTVHYKIIALRNGAIK